MVTRMFRRCVDALASRVVSFWVIGAWIALALVWLVPFQFTGQPEATLEGIGNDWLPFRTVHAALALTALACGLVRLSRDLRRVRRDPPLDRPVPDAPAARCDGELEDALDVLTGAGFDAALGPDRVVAVHRRWALLGGSLFHLAIPLLAAGLALHAATYGSMQMRLIEGQGTDVVAASIGSGEGRWEGLRSRIASLTLERVEPVFYRDILLFEQLEATVVHDRSDRRREFSLSSPLWLDPFTMLSIQDFGYAPHIQLLTPGGEVAEEVIASAAVFPPGSQDKVSLPANGYTVSMVVFPDHGVVGGRDVSMSYNLRDPRVLLGIERTFPSGDLEARRLVALGEKVRAVGFDVVIKDIRRFGVFRVWRSYGWPLIALSAVMMLAGLTARILFPCREVAVWRIDGGLGMVVRVDGRPGRAGSELLLAWLCGRIAALSRPATLAGGDET